MKHRIAKQALECPNCRTTHVCEIQRDEDGAYAEIETQPCHQDGCTKRLCPSCSQAECAECGLSHCEDHIIVAARGPICGVCFQKAVNDGVTARTLMTGGCETCNCNPCECGAPPDGQDGRDDLDDRDAHQIGSERCPPRE